MPPPAAANGSGAGSDKKLQPIIIKRIKKAEHGHHGGAWKIAYADFMTAMMAFFLLMWLLGSTAQGDLQGIAAYFNSPLKVAMTGGEGSGHSSSLIPGGGTDLTRSQGEVKKGETLDQARKLKAARRQQRAQEDAQRIKGLRAKIDAVIATNAPLNEYKSQIHIDVTPDGLQIQIVDEQNRPMFDIGSAMVKPYMRDILREVGSALGGVENRISLSGHTDSAPYGNGQRGYSNWELSADRANATRRELVAAGMPDEKLSRVVGLADSDLLLPDNPRAPQNRRITITVLTQDAEERLLGTKTPLTQENTQDVPEKQDNPAVPPPSL